MSDMRKINIKTKLLVFLLDYNHLMVLVMIFWAHVFLHKYDPFELRSEYYLSKSYKKVRGVLDKKWESDHLANNGLFKRGYDFSFILPEKGTFKGTSYSKFNKFNKGDSVTIEYVPDAPSYARIIKLDVMPRSKVSLWIGLTFLTTSFLWFFSSIIKFSRRLNLLKNGKLRKVRFVNHQPVKSIIPKSDISEERYTTGFRKYYYAGTRKKEHYHHVSLLRYNRLKEKEQFLLTRDNRTILLNRFPKMLTNLILKQVQQTAL